MANKKKRNPPPALKKPQKSVFGTESRVSTVKIEPENGEIQRPSRTNKYLRQLAEVEYTTSVDAITVESMAEDDRYKKYVKLSTLQRWCAEDHWVNKRNIYLEQIKGLLKAQIGSALVQEQYKQLKRMDELAEDVRKKLPQTEPKSYEGMVRALLGVEEFRKNARIQLSQAIVPDDLGGDARASVGRVVPKLSPEEAREAAHLIMRSRHRELQEKLRADEKHIATATGSLSDDEEEDLDGEAVD